MPTECASCKKDGAGKVCSQCKVVSYCSTECQNSHWKAHKPSCVPPKVTGVISLCNRERSGKGLFVPVTITPDHPIHTQGIVPPVMKRVGLPIVIYRHDAPKPLGTPGDPGKDNQVATYLMINISHGLAPPDWQQAVGNVTIMFKSFKPLTPEAAETIWMFHDRLLDIYGDNPSIPPTMMNRVGFDEFCKQYKEEQTINGFKGAWSELELPL